MALVQTLGSAVKASSSLTTVLTLGATTTVGNRVIVRCGLAASATGATLTLVDSKGNTWVQHVIGNTSSSLTGAIFSSVLTTALVPGDTLTLTQSGTATANGFISATEWSGLPAGSTIVTSTNTVSTTTATTITGVSATEAAGAAYFALLHTNNGTTPATTGALSAPWNTTESGTTGTSNLHSYQTWDETQASGATVAFTPTLTGASCAYVALLVAFTTTAPTQMSSAGSVTAAGTSTPTVSSAGAVTAAGTASSGNVAVIHSWVGAPTPSGFRIRSRMTGATSVRLATSLSSSMSSPTLTAAQSPDGNGYTDYVVTGLAPATQFYYQLVDSVAGNVGSVGKAKTLPAIGQASFKFAFGGCTNGYNVNREAVDDIRAWGADFMLHLGDFHYKSLTSTTASVHRQGWEDQINFAPGLRELVRDVPFWYCRSDHEAGPDNGDSNNAYTAASIAGYQQIVPYGTLGDQGATPAGLYQSWVVGRVRFILVDIRNTDRSPGSNTDDSSKTMLGATQKAWLKARLLDPEPVKVIVSDVAWMGPADIVAKPDAWWSYATERTEIASFIAANKVQVLLLHSDTHSLAMASPAKNTYGGFPVYCSAPLANAGGGRDLSTFDSSYSTTPTTTDSRQYGRVTVTDSGPSISFTYSGWDAVTSSEKMTRTDTFIVASSAGSLVAAGTAAPVVSSAGSLAAAGTAAPVVSSAGTLSVVGISTPAGTSTASSQGVIVASGVATTTVSSAGSVTLTGAAMSQPVLVRPTDGYRPVRAAVGGLLANRGIDRTGAQFTDSTKPTGAQVDAIISSCASEIDAELAGVAVTAQLGGLATWLITCYAAATIEVTFFPEQGGSSGTSGIWWTRYQTGLTRFRALLAEEGGGPSMFGSLQGTGHTLQAASDYADMLTAAGLLPDPLPLPYGNGGWY